MTSAKTAFLVGCMAITTISPTLAHGENYYKWIDRNGVTHYSKVKPDVIPASQVQIKPGNSSSTKPVTSSAAALSASTEISPPLKLSQPTEHQQAIQRSNCSKARRKLIALENAGRVRQLDDRTGEYRYLPNREKLSEISKMRGYLKNHCRSK
jgi:hypothetical protein